MGNASWQVSQNLSVKSKHEFETFLHQVNIVKKNVKNRGKTTIIGFTIFNKLFHFSAVTIK